MIEKARDQAVIETLPADQLGLSERLGVEAAGFAEGPTLDLARGPIERIDVAGGAGGSQVKAEVPAIVVPVDAADRAGGELRNGQFLAGGGIQQVQRTGAVLVHQESQGLPVVGQGVAFD